MKKELKTIASAMFSGISKFTAAKIARLTYREVLEADFKKIIATPTPEDIEGFRRISTLAMETVNGFLLSGIKFDQIKTLQTWKYYQNK